MSPDFPLGKAFTDDAPAVVVHPERTCIRRGIGGGEELNPFLIPREAIDRIGGRISNNPANSSVNINL